MPKLPADTMLGERFGGFKAVAKLGAGTMGEVFLAEHQRIARRAAIKVLASDLTRDAEMVRRFFVEARAISLIEHPSIVEVYDCDVHRNGRAYIVMEHLNGHSLADRVARSGPMPWERACRITRLVADAASAAHQKGIIHRDLKPANVLILTDSEWPAPTEVKVLDFGLAKLLGIDVSGPTTGAGRVLGTPEYMSPEQCMGGKIDHRSDIYSLGCLLFQTIAGRPPFTADRILALLAAHKFKTPPSLASAAPGVPGWLDRLVTRMLAKLPDERPQTMIEVVAALTGNA